MERQTKTTKNQIEGSIYCPETNQLLTHVYVLSQEKAKELHTVNKIKLRNEVS